MNAILLPLAWGKQIVPNSVPSETEYGLCEWHCWSMDHEANCFCLRVVSLRLGLRAGLDGMWLFLGLKLS